jgi:hypothetical protein
MANDPTIVSAREGRSTIALSAGEGWSSAMTLAQAMLR